MDHEEFARKFYIKYLCQSGSKKIARIKHRIDECTKDERKENTDE